MMTARDSETVLGYSIARTVFGVKTHVRFLGGCGRRSRVYANDTDGCVLKVFLRYPSYKAMREVISLNMLKALPIATPTLIDCCIQDMNPSWVLMSKMPSETVIADVQHTLELEDINYLCGQMGYMLREIHAMVPLSFVGELPEKGPRFSTSVKSACHRYLEVANQLVAHSDEGEDFLCAGREQLRALLVRLESISLPKPVWLHRDFGFRNTLVQNTSTGWHIAGLIDFESSYAGDAAEDVAKYLFANCFMKEREVWDSFLSAYFQEQEIDKEWMDRLWCYFLSFCFDVMSWACDIDKDYYQHACRCLRLAVEDGSSLFGRLPLQTGSICKAVGDV